MVREALDISGMSMVTARGARHSGRALSFFWNGQRRTALGMGSVCGGMMIMLVKAWYPRVTTRGQQYTSAHSRWDIPILKRLWLPLATGWTLYCTITYLDPISLAQLWVFLFYGDSLPDWTERRR